MRSIALFFRLIREGAVMAFQALANNRLRTLLSMLGISFGIFSIVLVNTIVDSMERNIRESFESFGQNVVYVQKWPWIFSNNYPWWKYVNRPSATYREADQLKERLESNTLVQEVGYMTRVWGKKVQFGKLTVEGVAGIAVSHSYKEINAVDVELGRYFTTFESNRGSQVLIMGSNLAASLFPNVDPIGQEVEFMGRKMTVVGVLQKKGKSLIGGSEDDNVIFPINFLRKIMSSTRFGEPSILVKGVDKVNMEELEASIEGAMRAIRRIRPVEDEDFALNKITMITKVIGNVLGQVNIAGFIIGIFAILVGGFGIANIMFVSVKERTNLIGIQKSLGAKRSFILFQFLTEAVVLSLLGGLLGVLFVFLSTFLVTTLFNFEVSMTIGNFVYANIISFVIGILAGIIPALNASRLDPVVAIRSK